MNQMSSDKENWQCMLLTKVVLGYQHKKHGNKTSSTFRDKEAKHCPLHHNSQVTIHGITKLLILFV